MSSIRPRRLGGGLPRMLLPAGVAVAVLVLLASAGALDPLTPELRTWPGWLLAAVLGAAPSTVLLVRAHLLNQRYRRSQALLLQAAQALDEVGAPNGQAAPAVDPLGADVLTAMQLSALRMHTQLTQERAFSGQTAHQLRTPLTALGLQLEELTMHPETPRQVRAELQRARDEVDRLADVISDLLALARRGALPQGRYHTDPAVLAVHATHRWAPSARAAGRELRVAGELPLCEVPAPAGPAAQVLDVLIDNALKHGRGDIEVSVAVMPDSVRLRVADQGAPEGPAAGRSSTAGEGIGLPVAEKLAVACGGRMVRALLPTTAFDLVLPRQAPADAAFGSASVR